MLAWGPNGFVEALGAVAEIGYDGVECPAGLVRAYEDRLHVFQEILEASGLRLCAMSQHEDILEREHADEAAERVANTARFLGANEKPCLVLAPRNRQPEEVTADDWVTVAAILDEMGSRCQEFGIRFVFRPRAGFLAGNDRDLKRLMGMTDPRLVHLCCDTAELTLAGMAIDRFIKTHTDRLHYVRLRDASGARRRPKTTSPRPGSAPLYGRGAVDFAKVGRALASVRYSGWVTVEIAGEAHPPREAAENAFRTIVRKSGLFL